MSGPAREAVIVVLSSVRSTRWMTLIMHVSILCSCFAPVTIKLSGWLSSILSLRAAVRSFVSSESPYGRYLAQEELEAVSGASGDRDLEAQDSVPCAICHDNLDTPVQLACR
jgi:hypothetical protein